MKNAVRRGAALLAVLLAGVCGARAEEADPTVVRVGNITYPRSVVQTALDTDLGLFSLISRQYYTEEDLRGQTEATLHRFIGNGLVENKLAEAGMNDFTPEEEELLKAAAREQYEATWQEAYRRLTENGTPPEEEKVTRLLEEGGYTPEAFLAEYKMAEKRSRAIRLFCPDVSITESQVREYYETMFLQPDRERYENHIDAYEAEILATGSESFYTPAGYRMIRQVLLDYPEEIARPLRNDYARLARAVQALTDATRNLASAAAEAEGWEDLKEARAAYDAAREEMDAARTVYEEKRRTLALPLLKETLEEIRRQYESGVDILTIIRQFSTDRSERNLGPEGYPFHPASDQWPEEFRAAASALQHPGELSEPVCTDAGIHLLYYAGDLPAGDHVLTEDEQESLNAAALYAAQSRELEKLFAEWMNDYEIETHPELLGQ